MFDLENVVDNQTAAEELEEVVMGLIINSGQARSLAYGALRKAKEGDSRELIAELIELHEKLK